MMAVENGNVEKEKCLEEEKFRSELASKATYQIGWNVWSSDINQAS